MKTYKITADIYITEDDADKAEALLKEILGMRVDDIEIQETILDKETDDSLCFMCERNPKQKDNDMCSKCWEEFLKRHEAKSQ